jgi:hypothetical protein
MGLSFLIGTYLNYDNYFVIVRLPITAYKHWTVFFCASSNRLFSRLLPIAKSKLPAYFLKQICGAQFYQRKKYLYHGQSLHDYTYVV